jgi:hypothetical protein
MAAQIATDSCTTHFLNFVLVLASSLWACFKLTHYSLYLQSPSATPSERNSSAPNFFQICSKNVVVTPACLLEGVLHGGGAVKKKKHGLNHFRSAQQLPLLDSSSLHLQTRLLLLLKGQRRHSIACFNRQDKALSRPFEPPIYLFTVSSCIKDK